MKIKNKGKVHPSPSSSSISALSSDYALPDADFFSVFKLLPAAILVLLSALSLEDREVLAYLITRSVKSVSPPSFFPETKKKSSERVVSGGCGCGNGSPHTPPVFDCDCFDCYRTYWFRWDSSVNRELIHQAIEAFEDQLTSGEKSKRNSGKSKRRDRTIRQDLEKPKSAQDQVNRAECHESSSSPEPADKGNLVEGVAGNNCEVKEIVELNAAEEVTGEPPEKEDDAGAIVRASSAGDNYRGRGIARKVLPDVLGLLNHRLWSLWSPEMY